MFKGKGEWGDGGRLDAEHAGDAVDHAQCVHFGKALGDAGDRAAIADADGDPVGDAAAGGALLGDFEAAGFLAFDEHGVDRAIAVVPAETFAGGGTELVGFVVVAVDREDARIEAE